MSNRKNFGAKPYCYPQPVFILATWGEDGTPDAMNAAWGGISDSSEISFSLSADHKTCLNFARTGAFTVSMADEAHVAACDYLGVVSGNDVPDKVAKAGFTVTPSELVNAPIINELAVCLECRVKKFEDGILTGEIVNVSVDEAALTDGNADAAKVKPIVFDPFTNSYLALGARVGSAFADGFTIQ